MFYATAMVCWIGIGCLLATSPNNTYNDAVACQAEVVRMEEALSTPPWFPYGPPNEVDGKCLSEADWKHLTEVEKE